MLAALDSRAGGDQLAGLALNLGETSTVTVRGWYTQILRAAGSAAELTAVPDRALPPDLALTGAPADAELDDTALAVAAER